MSKQSAAQLSYELAVYREQMQLIKRETERISLTTLDLTNALKAVENLETKKALIPIGGGTMIKGSIDEVKVLVPVGAQYLIEMEKEAAKEELERRIEATRRAVQKLTEEFNKITRKLSDVSSQLQAMESQSKLSERVDENIREDYI